MNRGELIKRVRSYTRDFSGSIFREIDIVDYINEGINRACYVPELSNMKTLSSNDMELELLPEEYHHLIAIYSASRCFFQDERDYQASTMMNEFEVKLEELKNKIEDGSITITDESGDTVETSYENDYVRDVYFITDEEV